ncbi:MAG: hypothetical protein KDE45_10275, partial [Caldilineaceae bacterium]|nr:hypothetical protein [Caldilineaceae bacterium]
KGHEEKQSNCGLAGFFSSCPFENPEPRRRKEHKGARRKAEQLWISWILRFVPLCALCALVVYLLPRPLAPLPLTIDN